MAVNGEVLTIVEGAGGLRFNARTRGHTVRTDQPEQAGGTDAAVTPLELLGAALGACAALYVTRFCSARGLPTDDLRVEVRATDARDSPRRLGHFAIDVMLPEAIPGDMIPLIERVVRTCPVHNTLAHPPAMDIAIHPAVGADA